MGVYSQKMLLNFPSLSAVVVIIPMSEQNDDDVGW
jgi:hypothetical protein